MTIDKATRELVDEVIRARDPHQKLAGVEAIRFPLHLGGLFFEMHGNQETFFKPDLFVTVWTKKRKVVFDNFPRSGQRSVYLEDRAFTESAAGVVVDSIDHVSSDQWSSGIAFGVRRRVCLSILLPAFRGSLEMIRADVGDISVLTEDPDLN